MSFRVALTGLRAANSDLGVSADNIANSNTNGFKASRAEFADIVAGRRGSAVGNLASGDGVRLASVTQQFNQGNIAFTGSPLDLAISGDGFFQVTDNGAAVYTRAGAFGTDRDGFLTNSLGQRLNGFPADGLGNITGAVGELRVQRGDLPPRQSTGIDVGANLDASAQAPTVAFDVDNPLSFNDATSLSFFDSLGSAHTATLYFRKTAANAWETLFSVDGAQVGGATVTTFDTSGALTAPAGGLFTTADFTPAGAAQMNLEIDLGQVTQFGSVFGVSSLAQDGFASGQISGLDVDGEGVVFARYTNGQSLALGQVALADFANKQGLNRLGDNAYAETVNSGPALIGTPGSASLGVIQSSALEESTVEITEELVNIILAQRNFQANAQVISASDTLTQTILNIS